MKYPLYLIIVLVLLISSCSPKFNYSTAYRFKHENISTSPFNTAPNQKQLQTTIDLEEIQIPPTNAYYTNDNSIYITKTEEKITSTTKSKALTKEEKKEFKRNLKLTLKDVKSIIKSDSTTNPKQYLNKDASKNWAAITGFSLAFLASIGFLIPGLFFLVIPGLIFSIIGIKSEKRGLAIAGTVINSLLLLLFLLLILFLIFYFTGF